LVNFLFGLQGLVLHTIYAKRFKKSEGARFSSTNLNQFDFVALVPGTKFGSRDLIFPQNWAFHIKGLGPRNALVKGTSPLCVCQRLTVSVVIKISCMEVMNKDFRVFPTQEFSDESSVVEVEKIMSLHINLSDPNKL